jgi:hypothetical protein
MKDYFAVHLCGAHEGLMTVNGASLFLYPQIVPREAKARRISLQDSKLYYGPLPLSTSLMNLSMSSTSCGISSPVTTFRWPLPFAQ